MISLINFNRYCLSKKNFFHKCYKSYFNHIQINSFNNFIKYKKKNFSIKNLIKFHFPIINKKKNIFLKLFKINIKKPFYNEKYCINKNIHFYSIIYIYIKMYLINKKIIYKKKYELCKIPFLNKKGNFIINGTHRILISQFIKSNGIFFITRKKKICKIIPNFGNWIELIYSKQLFFLFDKKILFSLKNIFISLGINKIFFFKYFFFKIKLKILKGKKKKFFLLKKKFFLNRKYNKYYCFSFNNIEFYLGSYYFFKKNFFCKFDKVNNLNYIISKKIYFLNIIIYKKNINNFKLIKIYKNYNLILEDSNYLNKKGKIFNFFKKIFIKKKYSFNNTGYKRIKKILFKKKELLNLFFILEIIKKIFKFIKFNIIDDNLDSLDNKIINSCGKLLSNIFEKSFLMIIKNIKFKIKNFNLINDLDLIIEKTLITIEFKNYFCNNELSQFLDQNNPLSEISHLRKISLIGSNIKKENCGFEIRDLHISHYCKICPIDTPEGHNIGLINSFSFYSKINKYNYISSIYKFSFIGKIIGIISIDYKKEKFKNIINFLNTILTIYGEIFKFPFLEVKKKNIFKKKKFIFIDLIEISGDQIISIGASLIPFFSNNDANRCLMGSNMQKQAVPLYKCDQPIVGTGNEITLGINSGYCILSEIKGYILYLDNYIIIIKNNFKIKKYKILNFYKTNQNTTIFQKININYLNNINKGDILTYCNVIEKGEITLGKNIRVAFMSWYGYNFEDSILISNKIVENNFFLSFHIYEYICVLKNNDFGFDILSDKVFEKKQILNNQVKYGLIRIGSNVKYKDVLIGKLCPKKKNNFSPEEKLFKIVFSDNNFNYYEQPLYVPKNINGIILSIDDFKLYSFKKKIIRVLNFEQLKFILKKIKNSLYEIIIYYYYLIKKKIFNKKVFYKNKIFLFNNNLNLLLNIKNFNKFVNYKLKIFKKILINTIFKKKINYKLKKNNILNYNDFDENIIRIIKIKIIVKKNLKIGDKMSGRHGNKGVISNIVNYIDMPYDIYGNQIEMILNPLGVPSRMNVGQLLEVYLSLSIKKISNIIEKISFYKFSFYKIKTIIKIILKILFNKNINIYKINNFDFYKIFIKFKKTILVCVHNFEKLNIIFIKNILKKIGISINGKILLFDGISGHRYIKLINVGYIYFLKLNHLVTDKIYSRSIGPYSMITQQPLGGKSNFGGQRLGEMEVWALEAYGASNILKEMLTVKSDDIKGRIIIFKNIVKGIPHSDSGIPESFQILIKEIKALCFDIKTI
ncbi:MAG: DNA-directed RNA polymerase subunit beta [Candidatus Carsonella ruddii]